ncbi:hypothetical protein PG991_012239 [Apiospora marii]|uniref:Uncharacterized protein n=1 Tax=Apiospora marii TaxID=335849 RepID=A0ABR1R9E3_9PEZI
MDGTEAASFGFGRSLCWWYPILGQMLQRQDNGRYDFNPEDLPPVMSASPSSLACFAPAILGGLTVSLSDGGGGGGHAHAQEDDDVRNVEYFENSQ